MGRENTSKGKSVSAGIMGIMVILGNMGIVGRENGSKGGSGRAWLRTRAGSSDHASLPGMGGRSGYCHGGYTALGITMDQGGYSEHPLDRYWNQSCARSRAWWSVHKYQLYCLESCSRYFSQVFHGSAMLGVNS